MSKKKYFIPLAALTGGILIFGAFGYFYNQNRLKIANFEECSKAGYLILETYPTQCRTPDGRIFIQEIGNELEKLDLIRIFHPRPNQLVMSSFSIEGEARGFWFFEADFPVKLFDENGKLLASGIAQALENWMTEDFVRFRSELGFEEPETQRGWLILEKDNPSGLPEYDDALKVPVYFELERN